jgi:hypothetical protein
MYRVEDMVSYAPEQERSGRNGIVQPYVMFPYVVYSHSGLLSRLPSRQLLRRHCGHIQAAARVLVSVAYRRNLTRSTFPRLLPTCFHSTAFTILRIRSAQILCSLSLRAPFSQSRPTTIMPTPSVIASTTSKSARTISHTMTDAVTASMLMSTTRNMRQEFSFSRKRFVRASIGSGFLPKTRPECSTMRAEPVWCLTYGGFRFG